MSQSTLLLCYFLWYIGRANIFVIDFLSWNLADEGMLPLLVKSTDRQLCEALCTNFYFLTATLTFLLSWTSVRDSNDYYWQCLTALVTISKFVIDPKGEIIWTTSSSSSLSLWNLMTLVAVLTLECDWRGIEDLWLMSIDPLLNFKIEEISPFA